MVQDEKWRFQGLLWDCRKFLEVLIAGSGDKVQKGTFFKFNTKEGIINDYKEVVEIWEIVGGCRNLGDCRDCRRL